MVLDPIPQSLPVHFFGSRPQPPTSPRHALALIKAFHCAAIWIWICVCIYTSMSSKIYIHVLIYVYVCIFVHVCVYIYVCIFCICVCIYISVSSKIYIHVQLIADRVALNLEIISKTFSTNQNSARGIYD